MLIKGLRFPSFVVSDAEEPELRLVRKAGFSTLLNWSPTVVAVAAAADRFAKTPQVQPLQAHTQELISLAIFLTVSLADASIP